MSNATVTVKMSTGRTPTTPATSNRLTIEPLISIPFSHVQSDTDPKTFSRRWDGITPSVYATVYAMDKWPRYFSNLEASHRADCPLSFEEINNILAVIAKCFKDVFDDQPTLGTFALCGRKTGRDCQYVLRFNLKNGSTVDETLLPIFSEISSDRFAELTIDHAVAYPDPSSVFAHEYDGSSDYLANGIHDRKNAQVMVIDTDKGHFLASFYANTPFQNISAVFAAVVVALARMGKEDIVLRRSVQEIIDQLAASPDAQTAYQCKRTVEMVQEMFHECRHPVLKAWEWVTRHDSDRVFFA